MDRPPVAEHLPAEFVEGRRHCDPRRIARHDVADGDPFEEFVQ
ncbi:MAG: hypothetical protein ABEH58_01105 [Haloplanus sp.]